MRRSLSQQAYALRGQFPGAKVTLTPSLLDWTDNIQPTGISRTYMVRITYTMRAYPKARILVPKLESRPGESLPHVWSDGSLCLHLDEDWTPEMLIVDTTVPWTSEWLIQYEIWKFTGKWYGGGEWPPRHIDSAAATDVILP